MRNVKDVKEDGRNNPGQHISRTSKWQASANQNVERDKADQAADLGACESAMHNVLYISC